MEKKVWTKTVLQAYNYINRICRVIDKHVIEKSSMSHLNSYGYDDTIAITESIIDLIERKRNLLQLKCLIDDSVAFLQEDLRKVVVLGFFDKQSSWEISEMLCVSTRTVHRLMQKALKQCYIQFEKNGYDVNTFLTMFISEPWLIGMYNANAVKYNVPELKVKLNPKIKFNLKTYNSYFDSFVT